MYLSLCKSSGPSQKSIAWRQSPVAVLQLLPPPSRNLSAIGACNVNVPSVALASLHYFQRQKITNYRSEIIIHEYKVFPLLERDVSSYLCYICGCRNDNRGKLRYVARGSVKQNACREKHRVYFCVTRPSGERVTPLGIQYQCIIQDGEID